MPRTLFASFLFLPATLLAACGEDGNRTPEYDATFSTAADAALIRAVDAALGSDGHLAIFLGGNYAALADDGIVDCPTFERDGARTILRGGCSRDADTRVEGSVTLENVAGLFRDIPQVDPDRPLVITFDGWREIDAEGESSLDGSVRLDPDGRLTVDLDADLGGVLVHTDAGYECGEYDRDACTARAGGWIDVEDVGIAGISGAWSFDNDGASGVLILDGDEDLVLDFDRPSSECTTLTIDGAARAICGEDD